MKLVQVTGGDPNAQINANVKTEESVTPPTEAVGAPVATQESRSALTIRRFSFRRKWSFIFNCHFEMLSIASF